MATRDEMAVIAGVMAALLAVREAGRTMRNDMNDVLFSLSALQETPVADQRGPEGAAWELAGGCGPLESVAGDASALPVSASPLALSELLEGAATSLASWEADPGYLDQQRVIGVEWLRMMAQSAARLEQKLAHSQQLAAQQAGELKLVRAKLATQAGPLKQMPEVRTV